MSKIRKLPDGISDSKIAKGRWWFGTWNNPRADWKGIIDSFGATYACAQLEQGEKGTNHIQFVLYFKDEMSSKDFKGTSAWLKCIRAKDSERVINYCSKADTRIDGPYIIGNPPVKNITKKADEYREALKLTKEGRWQDVDAPILIPYLGNLQKLSAFHTVPITPPTVRGHWFHGEPGTGKTFTARLENPDAYLKEQNKWWDNYAGQDVVILDDFDNMGSCLGHHLKLWLDAYPLRGEIKHGTVALQYTKFIITSNYLPEQIWPNDPVLCQAIRRRCQFREFKKNNAIIIDSDDERDQDLPVPNYFLQFRD